MNISYNWLKEYVDFELTAQEVADALTSEGLEVGCVEEVQPVKGGLQGLVIGEVLTCVPHPNSDHMHVCTVNLGEGEPVQIVCGAPNVAAGQKVVVATLGCKLYDGDECFTIKKSKLRGVESHGMICAEDEIGIGTDHNGIIVLPETAVPGTPAAEYYNLKSDYLIEVDITPNRADACSHYGVARNLYAWLVQNGHNGFAPSVVRRFQGGQPRAGHRHRSAERGGMPPLCRRDAPELRGQGKSGMVARQIAHDRSAPHQQYRGCDELHHVRLRTAFALFRCRYDQRGQSGGEDHAGRYAFRDARRRGT